jgi:hypothetical protein
MLQPQLLLGWRGSAGLDTWPRPFLYLNDEIGGQYPTDTDEDEAKLLRQTLEACNAACNAASQLGFEKFGPKTATKPLPTLLVP